MDFTKEMEERHKNAVNDFGLPDRLIVAEDAKLWRITGQVDVVFSHESWSWPDIIPVFSGDKEIGAATMYPVGNATLVASATVTHDLPERLDYENGETFGLLAAKSYPEEDVIRVTSLQLVRYEKNQYTTTPITTWEVL